MITRDTTTCDDCGRRYEFTSHKDRCPVCCPKDESDEDDYDYDQSGGDDSDFTSGESDESQQARAE